MYEYNDEINRIENALDNAQRLIDAQKPKKDLTLPLVGLLFALVVTFVAL